MKKQISIIFAFILVLMFALSACAKKTCHRCGETIAGDSVESGGRTYCSYDCYWDEAIFGY